MTEEGRAQIIKAQAPCEPRDPSALAALARTHTPACREYLTRIICLQQVRARDPPFFCDGVMGQHWNW